MKQTLLFIMGVVFLSGTTQLAKADEWDQKTVFTFSAPVEIPGQVLVAGTYVFKLADSPSNRNIVQVFNERENHLYGTFFTVPNYRLDVTDKALITFDERPAGTPEAVRAWFYPGEHYGHDFLYPKLKPAALTQADAVPVPPVSDEHAGGERSQVIVAQTAPPPAAETEPEIAEVVQLEEAVIVLEPPAEPSLPSQLPQTASHLPLIGILGLLSLGGAVSLRLVRG